MPRVKLFNEEEALTKAMTLFWEKGYTVTSLTDLTSGLGISKGSFYDTFGSKRALFDRSFELYRSSNIENLNALFNSEPNVKVGLRKLLMLNLEKTLLDEQRKGCFLGNVCSEMGGGDGDIQLLLAEHNTTFHKTISDYLKQDPKLAKQDVDTFTNVIITFLTGMNQEVKFKRDKESHLKSINAVLKMLD